MKHKIKAAVCIALTLCLALASTAYAASGTTAETKITYTKTEESGGSQQVPSPAASYEINIPAEVSLNAGRELYITADSMNLPTGESVVVSVDYDRSFTLERTETTDGGVIEDSYIKLDSATGDSFAKVHVNRSNLDGSDAGMIYQTDSTAAVFTGTSLQPTQYGILYLNLYKPGTIAPGTYTGTLHFTIELVY